MKMDAETSTCERDFLYPLSNSNKATLLRTFVVKVSSRGWRQLHGTCASQVQFGTTGPTISGGRGKWSQTRLKLLGRLVIPLSRDDIMEAESICKLWSPSYHAFSADLSRHVSYSMTACTSRGIG